MDLGVDLAGYVGDTLAQVGRLRYELDGDPDDPAEDSLELTFSSGRILLCEGGPDGVAVQLSAQAWIDPFAEPLSAVNAEYVRTHGKWVWHDVSAEDEYTDLVGSALSDVAPLVGTTGRLYGLVLYFGGYQLAVYNIADELGVTLLA